VRILVAGGAGFIGSHFTRLALRTWPAAEVIVLDTLTYAGNLANLEDLRSDARFSFVRGDICEPDTAATSMAGCSHVVNFAAETHVDRSILESGSFVRTDVEGTRVLLEAARQAGVTRYLQVSTDEVYGDLPAGRRAAEDDPLQPRSPYSASKAGGDLMTLAYHATFGLPVLITRGSNTYGPNQFPEKLIPLCITNALEGRPLPVYGDGSQQRDWLFVDDHCRGIAAVLEGGEPGTIYNLGAGVERPNLEVVRRIVALTGSDPSLIRHVPDRPGHDRRYALQTDRIQSLGWAPQVPFEEGLAATVEWYRAHPEWWQPLKRGEFEHYYRRQYASRLEESTP